MKRVFFIMLAACVSAGLFGAACGPGLRRVQVRPIAPVSPNESAAILQALRTGEEIPLREHAAPLQPPITATAPTTRDLCASFIAKLPRGFKSGWVRVPENWDQPQGEQIEIFYYARFTRAADGTSPLRPVVFFNGGPSSDSHSSYAALEGRDAARGLSFVYFDQRGTGCSTPYPATATPTAEFARKLALYGTHSIVRDAEAIRRQLLGEGSRWRAFGQSYGGFAVHRYIETAAEGLEAAYAHGASVMSDPVEWTALRMLSQKRVSADYFRAYPGDEAALARARAAITPETCFESEGTRVCGPSVLDAASTLLAFQGSWPTLHTWIQNLPRPGALDQFVRNFVFGVLLREGFVSSVLSLVDMTGGLGDRDLCAAVERRLASRGENPATWPVYECRALMDARTPWETAVSSLAGQGRPLSNARLLEALKMRALPFHLYSGQKDVMVPTETFREETAVLGARVKYQNFDFSGHEGFYTERQVWDDLISP